jgi:hypothetical protein
MSISQPFAMSGNMVEHAIRIGAAIGGEQDLLALSSIRVLAMAHSLRHSASARLPHVNARE